jgi:N6-L-threonylcarbamoyladenine synthase
MTDRPGLDFSFSGLKTHALTAWNKSNKSDDDRMIIASSFQDAVVDTILIKCKRAILATGCKRLIVAGGVGANQRLRTSLHDLMIGLDGNAYFPRIEYCTDNGAMVAYTGCMHFLQGEHDDTHEVAVKARWPLVPNQD